MKRACLLIVAAAWLSADLTGAAAATRRGYDVAYRVDCSWLDIFDLRCPPPKRWNRAAPPVYVDGEYVGQDPDPFIRLMIRRENENLIDGNRPP